jgi:chromosome segregation ATPase
MNQAKAAAEGEIKHSKRISAVCKRKSEKRTAIEDRSRSQIAESEAKRRAAEKKSASGRESQASLESKLQVFTAKKESLTEQLHQSAINAEAKSQLAGLKGEKADMSQSIGELRSSLAQATAEATKKERLINELRTGTEGKNVPRNSKTCSCN